MPPKKPSTKLMYSSVMLAAMEPPCGMIRRFRNRQLQLLHGLLMARCFIWRGQSNKPPAFYWSPFFAHAGNIDSSDQVFHIPTTTAISPKYQPLPLLFLLIPHETQNEKKQTFECTCFFSARVYKVFRFFSTRQSKNPVSRLQFSWQEN